MENIEKSSIFYEIWAFIIDYERSEARLSIIGPFGVDLGGSPPPEMNFMKTRICYRLLQALFIDFMRLDVQVPMKNKSPVKP